MTEPEDATQHADSEDATKTLLNLYWNYVAPKEEEAASRRGLRQIVRGVVCPNCKSGRIRTNIIGDFVCMTCSRTWRPRSGDDGPKCPACQSGRVLTLPYGDKKCQDCQHQWR